MKPHHATIRLLALAAVVFLVACGVYAFALYTVVRIQNTVGTLGDKVALETKEQSRLTAARSILASSASQRASLATYLLKRDDVASFIDELSRLQAASGTSMDVRSVDAKKGGVGKAAEELGLTVAVSGSWSQVMHFLSLIESLPYGVGITSIDFVNRSQSDPKKKAIWDGLFALSVALRN